MTDCNTTFIKHSVLGKGFWIQTFSHFLCCKSFPETPFIQGEANPRFWSLFFWQRSTWNNTFKAHICVVCLLDTYTLTWQALRSSQNNFLGTSILFHFCLSLWSVTAVILGCSADFLLPPLLSLWRQNMLSYNFHFLGRIISKNTINRLCDNH